MTELQKLSLKKLRRAKLPLFVVDQKSKRGGFMISAYPAKDTPSPSFKALLDRYDFKGKGLFWDRPDQSNKKFFLILKNPKSPEYEWAVTRLFERLPSHELLKIFPLSTLSTLLKRAKVRDFIRRPWEHAFEFINQKTSHHR
ncbi:MAG TPA: hypothetical protein DDW49_06520 [Deltaproteobacteria bacterium]|nr:hypothetical protein [Deltaproteobacteria bacterium]